MHKAVTRQHRHTGAKFKNILALVVLGAILAILGGVAISAQDKYILKVPNGIAFSECRGYEDWTIVSISDHGIAVIVANP